MRSYRNQRSKHALPSGNRHQPGSRALVPYPYLTVLLPFQHLFLVNFFTYTVLDIKDSSMYYLNASFAIDGFPDLLFCLG